MLLLHILFTIVIFVIQDDLVKLVRIWKLEQGAWHIDESYKERCGPKLTPADVKKRKYRFPKKK